MSLDVNLWIKKENVYWSNITHNLNKMAEGCGVYYACWRPDEINCNRAKHIAPMLESGIRLLKEYPDFYKQFDAPNGWGLYIHFLPWLENYYAACLQYPEAKIRVSR